MKDDLMFERYTDRARRAVVLAQEEARALHHGEVNVDHMLIGLAAEGEAVAFRALDSLGVSAEKMRAAIADGRLPERAGIPAGHMPFTPRLKKALELALRESLKLGHNYIGTEHLLLGLMRECEGDAGSPCAAVLRSCGTEPATVREAVMMLLRGYGDATAQEPAEDMEDAPGPAHLHRWAILAVQPWAPWVALGRPVPHTITLVRCRDCGEPDSLMLAGEWTLEQLRTAAEEW